MSKVDAQRAMREARYAAMLAAAPPTRTPVRAAPTKAAEPAPAQAQAVETAAVCGHRNIGNKSCQRPAGHTEKNHRYT